MSEKNDFIRIRGARVHNLKNIDLDIPKNKLVVITGLSGSGKSSLAFDTLYAEGQRRYVESLSAYARQFLGVMDKPDVDKIEGISPAISIDQRKAVHNPRSTVGTITEIYDYLRLLYARIGKPHCPNCGKLISRQTVDQIVDQVLQIQGGSETRAPFGKGARPSTKKDFSAQVSILGPVIRGKKGEHTAVLQEIQRAGFVRVRIDNDIYPLEEAVAKPLDKNKKHTIEAVVDRLVLDKSLDKSRLVDSLETALKLGKGIIIVSQRSNVKGQLSKDVVFSEHFACEDCGISLPELEPRIFSFNNPYGACQECTGLGEKLEVDPELVIPNKNLTIAEGAIRAWASASHKVGRQGYYHWKLQELATKYNFSLDEPVKNLPPKVIDIVLRGDLPAPTGANADGQAGGSASLTTGGAGFEGVIPGLERRYHETDSEWTRQEIDQYMVIKKCPKCQGKRLKPEVLAVTVGSKPIHEIVNMSVDALQEFFTKLSRSHGDRGSSMSITSSIHDKIGTKSGQKNLSASEIKISQPINKEVIDRLQFLIDVGLGYLNLDRKAMTLAGGEEQRIRLATQIGSKLSGVLYILDEPSIGLHARDQHRLIDTLLQLRDLGNTVIVVEHDPQTMMASDWIVDIGPGAGKHGGKVVFEGTPKQILKSHTLTGDYLSGRKKVSPTVRTVGLVSEGQRYLIVKGAKEHNLKNIDVKIPLGKFICVTGVSGSGKSSLVNDILARSLLKQFYRAKDEPGVHKEILGIENINKVVLVDQLPIGRTPRSNPVTYTGAFSFVRDIFTQTREAKIRGYSAGRFSFNVKGGRCEACEGQGTKKVEMYFLPDIYVECEECRGKRYSREVLEVTYKDKNITDVLKMTIEEAGEFFKHIPGIFEKMKTLKEVGLSYIELGQSATSLSGGEAQRIKLAKELSRRDTGNTLYILDEPTTGLHFEDIKKLVSVLRNLVERGNTVLTVEHNIDFIQCVDWILDLGPEGGEAGGQIIAEGTPAEIAKVKKSYTGKYLKNL